MDARSSLSNRWFRDALFFGLLISLPTGVFFYLQWPEWSWLYYVDPNTLGEAATALVFAAYPAATVLGFAMAAGFVRGDSPRVSFAVPLFGLILLVGVTALGFTRFITLSSYHEFNNILLRTRGNMPFMWSDPTWIGAMLGTGVFVGLPFGYLFVRNAREGAGFIPPVKP